jgi:hypothetical protein
LVPIEKQLDKFYSNGSIASSFCEFIHETLGHSDCYVIEPSAGAGAFVPEIKKFWKNYRFVDILGEHPEVENGDFLKMSFPSGAIFIGNPPFGKNSSLAVRFFNHAASFDPFAICMIHPKTFMKQRFWERLNQNYLLSHQYELPKNSFTFCGKIYDVPCVAQIWTKGTRETLPQTLTLFSNNLPEVLIRRAGASAGKIVETYTPSSTYRTGCSEETRKMLVERYNEIRQVASMTAGVRSITLFEIEDILLNRNTSKTHQNALQGV